MKFSPIEAMQQLYHLTFIIGQNIKLVLKVGTCTYQMPSNTKEEKEQQVPQVPQVGDIIIMDGSHNSPILIIPKGVETNHSKKYNTQYSL